MSHWLPLPRRERTLLVVIIVLSAIALLPIWRGGSWLGVSNLAWAMALLMIISPLLSFIRMRSSGGGDE